MKQRFSLAQKVILANVPAECGPYLQGLVGTMVEIIKTGDAGIYIVKGWSSPPFIASDSMLEPLPDDLCTAPGAADFTFGSVLSEMIRRSFQRHERAPGLLPRSFTECCYCTGNDGKRRTSARPSQGLVEHKPDCLLAKHLPRLKAMANKDVT